MIFICGYYEGYDECICEFFVIDELFIGDYVLIGGELFVMVVIDSVVCLILGVFGNEMSVVMDLFSIGLFEYLYYIWLFEFRGMKVLDVLLFGYYLNIDVWCRE